MAKRIRIKLVCNECGKNFSVGVYADPQCPKCNATDYEVR